MKEKLLMREDIDTIKEILNDIRKWLRFSGWNNIKNVLIENLQSNRDKLIYHFSDGKYGIRDIIPKIEAYQIKTSYGGIHGLWQKWSKIGIVEPIKVGSGFRYQKLFSLEDFGIEIPSLPSKEPEQPEEDTLIE